MQFCALPRFERHTPECCQTTARYTARCTDKSQIYLCNIAAFACTHIGHCCPHRAAAIRRRHGGQAGICKPCIGQSIPKRVKRLILHETVGAPLHGVLREGRQFLCCPVKGDWQLSTGVDFVEKHFGGSQTTHLTRVPHLQNCIAEFCFLTQRHCTAGGIDQHNRRTDGGNLPNQAALRQGQQQVRFIRTGIAVVGIAFLTLQCTVQADTKDNHIGAAGGVAKAVAMARAYAPFVRKIEIEVENLDQTREAVEAGADIIMLDNMSDADMRAAVQLIAGRAQTECSGNVTKENIARLKDIGVDFVSSGALTHSAPILDLSMKHLRPLDKEEA